LKELFLTAVFAVHAVVFARLYLRRGRRGFDLLFVGGFVLLTLFYASRSSLSLAGIEPEPTYLPVVRWSGLALCGLATPPFLIHWYRRRRGDPARL
jgi:uncharacterized membrane protein